MKKFLQTFAIPSAFVAIVLVFFYPFLLKGNIPIPADTIVGMYHPWRDVVWGGRTAGVPYKNPLITDPVRQQYGWRELAVAQMKSGHMPVWNPYSFAGTPLLANFQTAAFYPFNILFFVLPFPVAWGILVLLQPLLSGIFLYMFLRHHAISRSGSFLGSLAFAFSGFSIAWLEWNTIIHTLLWLPLILLAKDNLIKRWSLRWASVLLFAESASILAGHLQVLAYCLIVSNTYLVARIIREVRKEKINAVFAVSFAKRLLPFLATGALVLAITAVQWVPTVQFIGLSARNYDQGSWQKEGWFIPWEHLLQFIAPDFFGNPATGNYWGTWNYGEFVGFIGMAPLLFAFLAFFFIREPFVLFWSAVALLGIVFATPNVIAKSVFIANVPFLATSQPTRLMSVIDLSLAILAAVGFSRWQKNQDRRMAAVVSGIGFFIFLIWLYIYFPFARVFSFDSQYIDVAKRNMFLPTLVWVCTVALLLFQIFFRRKIKPRIRGLIFVLVAAITIGDLLRFAWKFTPFSPNEFLYPETETLKIIRSDSYARTLSADRRILPPNFSDVLRIQDVAGYDPLYLLDYNKLAGAWDRSKPDISAAAFNRIVTPTNINSFLTDVFGVRYILSFSQMQGERFALVGKEGQTYVYENKTAYPRAFMVERVESVRGEQEEIEKMFLLADSLRTVAVTREHIALAHQSLEEGENVGIVEYSPAKVTLTATAQTRRLVVLTDPYYPSWKVRVDGKTGTIHRVDFLFRGVIIEQGTHTIEFTQGLL